MRNESGIWSMTNLSCLFALCTTLPWTRIQVESPNTNAVKPSATERRTSSVLSPILHGQCPSKCSRSRGGVRLATRSEAHRTHSRVEEECSGVNVAARWL